MDQNSGPLEVPPELEGKVVLEGKPAAEPPAKATPEELMAEIQEIGDRLRAVILKAKRIDRAKMLDAHQDPLRSLSLAQSNLQTGFMWLRRAIEQPRTF